MKLENKLALYLISGIILILTSIVLIYAGIEQFGMFNSLGLFFVAMGVNSFAAGQFLLRRL